MNDLNSLKEKIAEFESLQSSLEKICDFSEKCQFLDQLLHVNHFLQQNGPIQKHIQKLHPHAAFVIKILIALKQDETIFNLSEGPLDEKDLSAKFLYLVERLLEIESFYRHIGGLLGYHLTVLKLILNTHDHPSHLLQNKEYIHPQGLYLDKSNPEVHLLIRQGIEALPFVGAIYPLGGAGERLNLKDESNGSALPVAKLLFLGKTLLEGLIRDIQAFEYLYFKLTHTQVTLPIAIMTSLEKDNYVHVYNLLKHHHWFNRPSSKYHLFIQPLVPVLTIEGNWTTHSPLSLNLKPSGHGVIWKIAEENGVFDWLENQGCFKAFVRQINNPLGGCDHALLALIGKGFYENKSMGFLSCHRLLKSDEGSNVLIENQINDSFEYTLTNIEYTEFAQKGIKDHPLEPNSPYSVFPANTNILFVDIPSIRQAVRMCPIPGQMINMKSQHHFVDKHGNTSSIKAGRLESMMQNIADAIIHASPTRLKSEEHQKHLKAFILYNDRKKTISTTKKAYQPGESPQGTPEQAYYDLLDINHSLLKQCHFELPEWNTLNDYLDFGPSILFLFHPALGPLHSIISQKIRKGFCAKGSELQLEIAEINIENIHIAGSLRILSSSPLGWINSENILQYGRQSRCTLLNTSITNKGIDREKTTQYWKNNLVRKEELLIVLHEGSEFFAEGVEIHGSYTFEVPPYHRLTLKMKGPGIWEEHIEHISKPTWNWDYTFNDENDIILKMTVK